MSDFANLMRFLYCILLALGLVLFAALIATPKAKGEGFCYRGTVTRYQAPARVVTHYSGTTSYGHAYAYKEYVPYAVEVQVHKDRYYSLSDLYRDRLYLEAFDLMREMRQKLNSLGSGSAPPVSPQPVPEPQHGTAPAAPMKKVEDAPPPKAFSPGGKTSAKALAILQASCYSCHNNDTAVTEKRLTPLRLDDPDAVSSEMRWAAFGMAAVREMPKAPASVKAKGEKELADWQAKHSLTDEQMKELLDGWVVVPQVAKK